MIRKDLVDRCGDWHRLQVYELGMLATLKLKSKIIGEVDDLIDFLINGKRYPKTTSRIFLNLEDWCRFTPHEAKIKKALGDSYFVNESNESTRDGILRIIGNNSTIEILIIVSRFAKPRKILLVE